MPVVSSFRWKPGCVLALGVIYFFVGMILLASAALAEAAMLFAALLMMLIAEAGALAYAFPVRTIPMLDLAPWRRTPRSISGGSVSNEGSPCIAAVRWKSRDISYTCVVLRQEASGFVTTRTENSEAISREICVGLQLTDELIYSAPLKT